MKYPEKESARLEFKQELPKNNQLMKTIVGFCNQHGGRIIIGIENDGTIKGLSEEAAEEALEHLDRNIYEGTCPPIIPLVYAQNIGNKKVVIIEVSAGMNKPYFIRNDGLEQGTYIRIGRNTLKATADMLEDLKWTARGRSYDSLPVYHAEYKDLNLTELKEFFRTRKGSKKVPKNINEALNAYNLIVEEHGHIYPTVGGILLFGKDTEKFFTEAIVICTHFAGMEGREALATRDCTGTLIEQFNEAFHFTLSRLNRSFTIQGALRIEQFEVPELAVREAILNAIMHRNYHIKAPIKIFIYDNRIEIFSPGGFMGPISQQNLKTGLTYIRNTVITKVFRELGYIEKMGTGLLTIFSSYEMMNLKEPTIIDGENFVKCILPRPYFQENVSIADEDYTPKILALFETATEISSGEIIDQLQAPRATIVRKLTTLTKEGLLKKIGQARNTRYKRVSKA